MKTEMAHSASKEAVEKFDKNNMKHVETQEKNPLPDGEGILIYFHINLFFSKIYRIYRLKYAFGTNMLKLRI